MQDLTLSARRFLPRHWAARPQALARFVIGEKKPARRQPLLMSMGVIEIEIALTQNVTITDDTLCVERWRGAWPAKNGSKLNPSPFFVYRVAEKIGTSNYS